MKKVIAVIRPFSLDEVRERLTEVGVRGLVVTEVKFEDPSQGKELEMFGLATSFSPRLKIETVVTDELVDEVIATVVDICAGAVSGKEWIAVVDVEDAVRIRTGERGEEVL